MLAARIATARRLRRRRHRGNLVCAVAGHRRRVGVAVVGRRVGVGRLCEATGARALRLHRPCSPSPWRCPGGSTAKASSCCWSPHSLWWLLALVLVVRYPRNFTPTFVALAGRRRVAAVLGTARAAAPRRRARGGARVHPAADRLGRRRRRVRVRPACSVARSSRRP